MARGCADCAANLRRSRQARAAIMAAVLDDNDLRTQVEDLIADLLHLARFNRWDIDQVLEHARAHFEAEVHGGPDHGL